VRFQVSLPVLHFEAYVDRARGFIGDRREICEWGRDHLAAFRRDRAPLTYMAPVADETTRTIQVRFEVENRQGQLKPHEYVEVALTLSGAPAMAVPVSALTTIDKTRGVFLESQDGYTFAPIDAGRESGGWVEIRAGVKEGTPVVTEGVFDLKNVLLKEQIGSGD
jgi:cobalt-zinc-cadmium efflux system membrane fusion protein